MIVGEKPGEEEVKVGEPFVGPSGRILFRPKGLLKRNEWYITNVVKCQHGSVEKCKELFLDEINEVISEFPTEKEVIVVLLGKLPAEVMGFKYSVELSGAYYRKQVAGRDVLFVISVHPAYVLRNNVHELLTRGLSPVFKRYQTAESVSWHKVSSEEMVEYIKKHGSVPLAVDVEVVDEKPYSIAIASSPDTGVCARLTPDVAKALLEHGKKLIFHSAAFDIPVLEALAGEKFDYSNLLMDTIVLYHWLWSDFRKGLDALSPLVGMGNYKSEFLNGIGGWDGVEKAGTSLFGLPDDFWKYNAYDAVTTYRLYDRFGSELSEELTEFWNETMRYVVAVIVEMEKTGLLVNRKFLLKQKVELEEEMALCLDKLSREGVKINPASPKEVLQYFRQKGVDISSTRESVLDNLSTDDPVAKVILAYRHAQKLKSTYVDGILEKLGSDGRLRARFNITGSATHRLSSSNPNLQNLPPGWYGRALTVPSDKALVVVDYSQIELRVLAIMSGDRTLIDEFNAGVDLHDITAREILGYRTGKIPPEVRKQAKGINFGMVYGLSPQGLARELGVSETTAQRIINRFFQKYARVKEWREEIYQQALKQGYVETLMGRRRWVTLFEDKSLFNTAVNSTIQGSAMDIVEIDMARIYKARGKDLPKDFLFVSQVHDALYFEVNAEYGDFCDKLKSFIEDYWKSRLPVPIVVKVEDYGNITTGEKIK